MGEWVGGKREGKGQKGERKKNSKEKLKGRIYKDCREDQGKE